MAFGINRRDLAKWKQDARNGKIAFITHYWYDPRFPYATTVTKVACEDKEKLVRWGKQYGLKKEWIHKRDELSHFDLLGETQETILQNEGFASQLSQFNKRMECSQMNVNQDTIREDLYSKETIQADQEIRARVEFLKTYAKKTKTKGYVLGISGGQDSSLAAKLAQMAVKELREEEQDEAYRFYAVRLPYGEQHDEEDAQLALSFIEADTVLTVNIKEAVDASVQAFKDATNEELSSFLKGNTKARERMKVQFDLAAHYQALVIGTDHAAEAVTGFFTKFGDGACDVAPLFGLTKRQGKRLLQELSAPESLYTKVPTADLEDDKPGLPDEEALGVSYAQIDDYLVGKKVDENIAKMIEERYERTEHKRQTPVTIYDHWWE